MRGCTALTAFVAVVAFAASTAIFAPLVGLTVCVGLLVLLGLRKRVASAARGRDVIVGALVMAAAGYTFANSPLDIPEPITFAWRYVAAAALAGLLFNRYGMRLSPAARPFAYLLLAAWIWVTVTALWAPDPATTLLQSAAIGLLFLVAVGLTIRWQTHDPSRDLASLYCVAAGSVAAGLVAYVAGMDIAVLGVGVRGIHPNPNMLGAVAALALPLGIALAVQRRSRLLTVVALLPLAALALSLSRTSQVAAVLALIVVGWSLRHRLPTLRIGGPALVAAAVAVTAIWVFGPPAVVDDVADGFEFVGELERANPTEYTTFRIPRWGAALDAVRDAPVAGYGYRTGTLDLIDRFEHAIPGLATHNLHNGYVQALVEVGVVGLALLLAPIVYALTRHARPSPATAAARGMLAAGLTVQLGESFLVGAGTLFSFVFWIAPAVLVAEHAANSAVRRHSHSDAPRRV